MSNYLIRDETPQDRDGIRAMHNTAFGGTAEAKLADDLRDGGDVIVALVAAKEEKIIGHIMLSRLKAPMKALTMAPFAVHPDFQGQGIGLSLIRTAFDHARQNGWTAVFVLGGTDYYERVGYALNAADGFSPPYGAKHFIALNPVVNVGGQNPPLVNTSK